MGGSNVSQNPTLSQDFSSTSGNVGAGGQVYDSTIMPLNFANATNPTLSITDVSPAVFSAATAAVNKALEANELVTNGALNLATSEAQRASELAAASTGSGPLQGLIGSFGKYLVIGLVVVSVVVVVVVFWPKHKRKK